MAAAETLPPCPRCAPPPPPTGAHPYPAPAPPAPTQRWAAWPRFSPSAPVRATWFTAAAFAGSPATVRWHAAGQAGRCQGAWDALCGHACRCWPRQHRALMPTTLPNPCRVISPRCRSLLVALVVHLGPDRGLSGRHRILLHPAPHPHVQGGCWLCMGVGCTGQAVGGAPAGWRAGRRMAWQQAPTAVPSLPSPAGGCRPACGAARH